MVGKLVGQRSVRIVVVFGTGHVLFENGAFGEGDLAVVGVVGPDYLDLVHAEIGGGVTGGYIVCCGTGEQRKACGKLQWVSIRIRITLRTNSTHFTNMPALGRTKLEFVVNGENN